MQDPRAPRQEWHSRGYLPHWERGAIPQGVTFRLHDSLPRTLRDAWEMELARPDEAERTLERRKLIERALDAHHGACHLRRPPVAALVQNALLHFDGARYQLHAWCIMPNHVHVLFTPRSDYSLSSVVHSWKSYSAKQANLLLNRTGPFWMEEYFDRAIRDERHFYATLAYIEANPVKAGLCDQPEDWPAGSAAIGIRTGIPSDST